MATVTPAMSLKVLKPAGAELSEAELEVAKALVDLEQATDGSNPEWRALLQGVQIRGAKCLPIRDTKQQVIIICTPCRVYTDFVRPIQGRLVSELEKKTKKFVVFFAQRKILPKGFKRVGLKFRPRSRTLMCVHQAILEDIVAPIDIVGKRYRFRSDGKQLLKVQLDHKDRMSKDNLEEKLSAYAAAYQSLTRKQAIFHFSETA